MRLEPARQAALLLAFLGSAGACGGAQREPCASAGSCEKGQECLANRCVPVGIAPVHPDTRRLVLEPTELSVVSSRRPAWQALPGAIAFGARAGGTTSLYLRFHPRWRGQHLQSAFLLLEPMPGTARTPRDIRVDVWRVRDAWQKVLDPLRPPRLAPPRSSGIARSGPPLPLRIEVTEIVRWLDRHPRSDHGIALSASSVDEHGASFATGATVGVGPRLELYVR